MFKVHGYEVKKKWMENQKELQLSHWIYCLKGMLT